MKRIIAIMMLVCGVGVSTAFGLGRIVLDANEVPIQGFTPDPLLSVLVSSTASKNFPLTSVGAFEFTNTGSTCKGRIMKTTTKASWPQFTIPASGVVSYPVHKNNLFFNISGCTGDYKAQ